MRLKRVEIFGFKSFADRVVFEFPVSIVAIVGPNGCGKSNVADAFRWVLGEQSAKSMRGSRMHDVIFSGTAQRKPLNFAEVTLTFSDVQAALPVDYEEVSITRRLHRSGESEYLINRHPVRLKDVQDLLLDSGMGPDAFSIFEQGKIDQVIHFTPLERRYIFEEAAGILRFLQRKREALRKLEQAEGNIARVRDIHQEVEKQIFVLEKQVVQAREYQEKKERLEYLEKALLLVKRKKLEGEYRKAQQHEAESKALSEQFSEDVEKLEQELEKLKEAFQRWEKELRHCQEELFHMRSEKEIRKRERESAETRAQEACANEQKLKEELKQIVEKRGTRQVEHQANKEGIRKVEEELDVLEQELEADRQKVFSLEKEVATLRREYQASQKQQLEWLQKDVHLNSGIQHKREKKERDQHRLEQLQEEKKQQGQIREGLVKQVTEKKGQLEELSSSIDHQKADLFALEKRIANTLEEIQEKQSELEGVDREITTSQARKKMLLSLREAMEGFSVGAKQLLKEGEDPKSPLYQKVKGLYEYLLPNDQEDALAITLRSYNQTLVVKTAEDLRLCLQFAKEHKLRDFSLLCEEHLFAPEQEETTLSSRFSQHFLKDVVIVKNLEEAWKHLESQPQKEIWTEDHLFIDKRRTFFSTTTSSMQGEGNVFLREAELKKLEQDLADAEKRKKTVQRALEAVEHQKALLQEKYLNLDQQIRKGEMKLIEVNFFLQRLSQDLEEGKDKVEQTDKEIIQLQKSNEELAKELEQFEEQRNFLAKQIEESKQKLKASSEELEEKEQKFQVLQQQLREQQEKVQRVLGEKHRLLHARSALEVRDEESLQQEKRLEQDILLSQQLQKRLQKQYEDGCEVLEEIEKQLEASKKRYCEYEEEVEKQQEEMKKQELHLKEKRVSLKEKENALYQAGIQRAQWESSFKSVENELSERYQILTEEMKTDSLPLEKTPEQTERQIRTLKRELEAIGNVNMTSIEECDKAQERHAFLSQQIEDLTASKQELLHIITELDAESRKLFKTTFEVTREKFQKNFAILFGGGEADLLVTESQDVLEAGVEIVAKPPGKQMRSLNLLSGGEKCLTAMALLFAIFEVKPAPFCILDEMDAPLDDSNVDRFVKVLMQFIDKCQFIIITHNKRTMTIADLLYGISMEEKGISKLLSLELPKPQEEYVLN